MSQKITMYVERVVPPALPYDDETTREILVTVQYNWIRGYAGDHGPHGEPLSPPEPAYAEIQSVTDATGEAINLTYREIETAEEMIQTSEQCAMESAMENRREREGDEKP